MKIIVTGAKGFFGPGIVARLRAAGHDVIGASRRLDADARFDVTNPDSCRALIRTHPGVEAIVHAAALAHVPPGAAARAQCEAVNVQGTRNLAQAAEEAGITRFVFISSVAVYGDHDLPRMVTESTPVASVSMYGAAKRRAEEILARHTTAMQRWVLRMATMYSPEWLYNVRKRVSPPVIGRYAYFTLDPHGRRYSLCSRANGAEAVLWAVEGRIPPDVYNVADQYVYSQADILRAVEAVEGQKRHISIPVLLPRAVAALSSLVPFLSIRENARSRYWKFCEHNVYPSNRLASAGLSLPPHLLEIGAPACR